MAVPFICTISQLHSVCLNLYEPNSNCYTNRQSAFFFFELVHMTKNHNTVHIRGKNVVIWLAGQRACSHNGEIFCEAILYGSVKDLEEVNGDTSM
jgi:hypothetical protein